MDWKREILNKPAKITFRTDYVVRGQVLEITDSHHIIRTDKGKVMEIENDRIRVEVKSMTRFESPLE